MKLADHVQIIKKIIEKSFDKEFSKLGILPQNKKDASLLSESLLSKRAKFESILKSHESEMGSYEKGRERAIDELTFTLFNRLAAIKVMEARQLFPPIITKSEEHGNRSFGHKIWLEENTEMYSSEFEGLRDYLIFEFDKLGETLPLYNRKYPYALLPDVISLNDIIEKINNVDKDNDIDNNLWSSDDILGWLYESYNNDKKTALKDSGEKTEYDKVSLQSQVYTPRWVVEFLVNNSLGKLYMEMYPDSNIGKKLKIANLDDGVIKESKPITEIKSIDPACGSGNFLLYTFDLLYELYLDQINNYDFDMQESDIAQSIIENNIYGVDLDDRAIQLAQLGLYIKVKSKRKNVKNLNFNIVSSSFFLPSFEEVKPIFSNQEFVYPDQMDIIQNIWNDLKYAYKFGSLIRLKEQFDGKIQSLQNKYNKEGAIQQNMFEVSTIQQHIKFEGEFFENLEKAVKEYARSSTNDFLCKKTSDAIKFLEILTLKYDITTVNPPYTASAAYGNVLKEFINKNYKKPVDFTANLYACFIKRCYELTSENGKISLIHPHTFMYIKDYQHVREFIIDNTNIDLLVDYGLDRVNLFGPGILLDATYYVLSKNSLKEYGYYLGVTQNLQEKYKKEVFYHILDDLYVNKHNERLYKLNKNDLKKINSCPFIYWISDDFRCNIAKNILNNVLDIRAGIQTSNNERFLRFWWEICEFELDDNWITYAKGGNYQKWYGNLWLTINWHNKGKYLQDYLQERGQDLHAQEYYYKEGVTYTASGSKGASFRYLPENCLFDIGGSSIFPNKYTNIFYYLAFLNSKLSTYILNKCLNPTANKQPNDIKRIPFVIPDEKKEEQIQNYAKENINIVKEIKSYVIYEYLFDKSPFYFSDDNLLIQRIKNFLNYENYLNVKILINESIINDKIFQIYALSPEDLKTVIDSVGESIVMIPCNQKAKLKYIEKYKQDKNYSIKIEEYIKSIPEKECTDNIAQQDFDSIYQKNNSFEEFCIKKNINPIEAWYLFQENEIIPTARAKDITMEFLVDLIRKLLDEDDDGIIPLTQNVGETYLYERIQNKMYNLGFTDAQFSSLDSLLGKNLKIYLEENFFADFSDYLNLFMYLPKTPYIWHISSGKERAFECYVSIYKWSRNNLMRLRSVYTEHRERTLKNRQSDIENNNSAGAQAEKEKIRLQLDELKNFNNKIDDLLESGYNPVLEDGVGKNIAPLQKRGMIAYNVLNAGQLKKYLNASW